MAEISITINDKTVKVEEGVSVLDAARSAEVYIPSLCAHPDLPPFQDYPTVDKVFHGSDGFDNTGDAKEEGCRLCLVEMDGGIVRACSTLVKEGSTVRTVTEDIEKLRKMHLSKILSTHPHACLTCAQREGCTREPCSTNVPVDERCCSKFGNCELQRVSEYIGIPEDTPRYIPAGLPKIEDEPIFNRDYNLCIGCSRCVRACSDLRGVKALGMVYQDGEAVVGTIATTLKESECKFCGACSEVCPTGAIMDKLTSAAFDLARGLPPCTSACPVHMNIPEYTRLIASGKLEEALAVIREKVPFPKVLGRICMHPCESNCRRAELNDPIAICALKRYASDADKGLRTKQQEAVKVEPTGKKIAVIGSGPAGMTAAFYLARAGHSVTIFESASKPGGMLTQTIPLYRLPSTILDADIQEILEAGEIELRQNESLGKDFTIKDLKDNNYDAVFLAVGLQQSRKLDIEGADVENVMWGLDFLKHVRSGEIVKTGENVIVIGGGNVAVDVARTARRLGAQAVSMACLETRDEMPAHDWEITAAEEEDVKVHCSWGPLKINTEEGRITGVDFKRCTCVFDDKGNFCPEYDASNTMTLEGDTVILAVGQTADNSFIDEDTKSIASESGMLKVDIENLQSTIPGVYAGGDIVKMPGMVIDAINMGRIAAGKINKYLGGSDKILDTIANIDEPSQFIGRDEGFFGNSRVMQNTIDKDRRLEGFDEVELTYKEKEAIAEASRCLQCDLRLKLQGVMMPPEPYLAFTEEQIKDIPEAEGVIQLLDENKEILTIKGTMNLHDELKNLLETNDNAKYFIYEEDPMYTKRESELLQQYMQKHGKMPGGGEEDDDLF